MNTTSKAKKFHTEDYNWHLYDYMELVDGATTPNSSFTIVPPFNTSPLSGYGGNASGLLVDGITLSDGDRILVKDYTISDTNVSNNGIWIVRSGEWERPDDWFPTNLSISTGTLVPVGGSGQINRATQWVINKIFTGSGQLKTDAIGDANDKVIFTDIAIRDLEALQMVNASDPYPGLPSEQIKLIALSGTINNETSKKMKLDDLMLKQTRVNFNNNNVMGGGIITDKDVGNVTDAGYHFMANLDGEILTLSNDTTNTNVTDNNYNYIWISERSIPNHKLISNSIMFHDNNLTHSVSVQLGQSLTISGYTSSALNCDLNENDKTFTLSNSIATLTSVGVASFSANNFDVDNGLVSVKVKGIHNIELDNSSITFEDDLQNSTSIELGQTLKLSGSTYTGLNCTVPPDGTIFTLSNSKASTTGLGVASFSANNFTVTNGSVSLKDGGITNDKLNGSITNDKLNGGITNDKLANNSITFGNGINTTDIQLGSTIKIEGSTATGLNCSLPSDGTIFTLSNSKASTTGLGVASFSASNFSVTNGSVSLKDDGITNDKLNGGITNDKLAHSSLGISASNSTENIPLGGTLSIKNGSSNTVTVETSNNEVIINTKSVQFSSSHHNMQISIGNAGDNTSKYVYIDYTELNGSVSQLRFLAYPPPYQD